MNTTEKELLEALKMFVAEAGWNSSTKCWTIGPMADGPGGKMDVANKLIMKVEGNFKENNHEKDVDLKEIITAWRVEDIVELARETNRLDKLDRGGIHEIAEKLRHGFDANTGMSWDDIGNAIDEYIQEKTDKTMKKGNLVDFKDEDELLDEKLGLDSENEKIAAAHRHQLKLHHILESLYGFETPEYEEMKSKIRQHQHGQLIGCGVCLIYPLGKEGPVLFFNDGNNTLINSQGNVVDFKDIDYPNGPRGEWILHALYEIEKNDYHVKDKGDLVKFAEEDIQRFMNNVYGNSWKYNSKEEQGIKA